MDNRTNISLIRNLHRITGKKNPVIRGAQPNISELNEGEPLIRFVKGELIEYVKFGSKIYEKKYENSLTPGVDYKLLPNNLTTKPEYDSGWFDVNNVSNYTKTHNLGTKFLIPMIFAREKSTTRIWNLNNIGLNEYGVTDADIRIFLWRINLT